MEVKAYVLLWLVLTGLSITRGDLLALAFDCLFSLAVRPLDLLFLPRNSPRGSPLYIGRGPGFTGVQVGLYNITASGSTLLVLQGKSPYGGLPLWALSRHQV